MLGTNKKINDLLEQITLDAEELIISHDSKIIDTSNNLFDFSIKAFQVENISNLDSIDELLKSILDFMVKTLNK